MRGLRPLQISSFVGTQAPGEVTDRRGDVVMRKGKSQENLEKLLVDFTEGLDERPGLRSEQLDSLSQALKKLDQESSDLASPNMRDESILSLLETVRAISAVVQPKPLPEGLMSRVSQAVQERFQEKISREKIQRIIGMAVTMEGFRKSLFHDAVAACRTFGLSLTPKEIAALSNLKEDAVNEFANSLDERITKFFPADLPYKL